MNTKTEIDFEKILDEYCNAFLDRKCVLLAMKEVSKQVRDIILREAAEKADIETMDQINFRVDKSSILNLKDSKELNERLGLK